MSSKQLIVNELLAFIQNAIGTMDEVSILQICKEDEVCSDKVLLFRKGAAQASVTFDQAFITRLLKDINFLKASLADVVSKLQYLNNTIACILPRRRHAHARPHRNVLTQLQTPAGLTMFKQKGRVAHSASNGCGTKSDLRGRGLHQGGKEEEEARSPQFVWCCPDRAEPAASCNTDEAAERVPTASLYEGRGDRRVPENVDQVFLESRMVGVPSQYGI
ncbi:unnamed protein product [Chilo suppressalis]|uniref:Uncharacterized protein n=1 Tax=Chilo suppressalis TaxID=168631 RepID=A0ABN8B5S2_CHISP|nr:unnamed protein product [Chilo suppressalis]